MFVKEKSIALNFLPLVEQEFSFTVFRKKFAQEKKEGIFARCQKRDLPIDSNGDSNSHDNRAEYWVSHNPMEGFEQFSCRQDHNRFLTEDLLLEALKSKIEESLSKRQYIEPRGFSKRQITFVLQDYPEGQETVWLEPYYLSVRRTYGFLVDFEFRKKAGVPFSRRVQQLSLSLDRNWKSNTNFYLDRYEKIQAFLKMYYSLLFPVNLMPGLQIDIIKTLFEIPASQLDTKKYVFANNKENISQYKGVKENGPFEPVKQKVVFYFMFPPNGRDSANQLYQALRGDLFKPTFPGMFEVFGVPIERSMVRGNSLPDYSKKSFENAIAEIRKIENAIVIPILLIPSKTDEESRQIYYLAKYLFINENIPLQVVTLDLLRNIDTFKWSVSNIGLQIFSKLGAKPWKVKPSNEECLIIGIGQSHDEIFEGDKPRITKYFAYSVLTDSSGLYLDLEVLGTAADQPAYVDQLKNNLKRIVETYGGRFKKIVIHTPYKIKLFELESISQVLNSLTQEGTVSKIEFVVLKVNTQNRFFGYDLTANSKVPFESTYLRLSKKDYLVWFEGLQYHSPNVYKRFAGPTHIEFYYSSIDLKERRKTYLQDVLNLSGANWRGFNAKSMPVSILYCQLVARFIKEFNILGYHDYKIDNLKPWFL